MSKYTVDLIRLGLEEPELPIQTPFQSSSLSKSVIGFMQNFMEKKE